MSKIYSDSDREIPLSESEGLVWLVAPGEEFNKIIAKLGLDQSRSAKQKSHVSSRNLHSIKYVQNSPKSMEQPQDKRAVNICCCIRFLQEAKLD